MKIWKWQLQVTDTQTVEMPQGAMVLTVQIQYGSPHLWALVDESAPLEYRRFVTYGTGNPVKEDEAQRYVATYQLNGGDLVFHVFECI